MSDYEITSHETTAKVTLGAKLTAAEVKALQAALKREIEGGARELVFDFGALRSLDSTGIGLLVATGNSMSAVKGRIRLIDVSPDVMKLLRGMRLVDRLNATEIGATHG